MAIISPYAGDGSSDAFLRSFKPSHADVARQTKAPRPALPPGGSFASLKAPVPGSPRLLARRGEGPAENVVVNTGSGKQSGAFPAGGATFAATGPV